MNLKNILLKVVSLTICTFIISALIVPIIVNASSLADSAQKKELKIVEDIEKYVDENKYPGYKEKILALKKANSDWKFTLYYTGLDWNTVIYNQTKGLHSRSLVQGKTGEWLCAECGTKVYDAGGWMCASEKAVSYLMDVRNYLNESYIFQFEELSYNPDTYTIAGIEKVLNGTFMYQKSIREYYNNSKFEDITFSEAIIEAASSSGVSPYYLAARIRQEIGVNGSDSIYGTYKGYEGIYNFYNIGANSGEDPIGNGLKYASNTTMGKYLLPWNDPAKAIKGGAIWIAANYIAVGQDTLYFQKYDVVNNGTTLYNHQYMQNIFAARNEGYTTYLTYKGLDLLDNNYNFIIPVYENMPKTLSAEPKDIVLNTQTGLNEKVQLTGDNVILRKTPTTSGQVLATLKKLTILTRIEKNSSYADGYYWDKVKLLDGTIGYIVTNYLSTTIIEIKPDTNTDNSTSDSNSSSSSSSNSTIKTETVKVNASNVRVRKTASTSGAILTTLAKNTVVTRLEKKVEYKNGYYWDKVQLSNGTVGYIATNYLSSISTSSTTTNKTETVKVNASNVRVRKTASTSGNILATLSKGTKVTRLEKKVAYKNGYYWDKVQLSNGTVGYIATNYLSSISTSSTTTNKTETVKINSSKVNVRKSATTSSKKIATLSKGTKLTRIEKKVAYKNGYYWDKVKLSNGTIGYIASKYLS